VGLSQIHAVVTHVRQSFPYLIGRGAHDRPTVEDDQILLMSTYAYSRAVQLKQ
jgi:hypothetical protein